MKWDDIAKQYGLSTIDSYVKEFLSDDKYVPLLPDDVKYEFVNALTPEQQSDYYSRLALHRKHEDEYCHEKGISYPSITTYIWYLDTGLTPDVPFYLIGWFITSLSSIQFAKYERRLLGRSKERADLLQPAVRQVDTPSPRPLTSFSEPTSNH